MSAEDLGRRLLGECAEPVGLDRVLKSLRMLDEHVDASPFNLAPIDRVLHRETKGANETPGRNPIHKSPVIEVCSEESGAGKTHLLYSITAMAILPQNHGDVELDGKNSAVIIIDTDGRFHVARLAQIMHHYITSKDETLANPKDLISRSLKHVHIFRPQSMAATIATLSSLQPYIFSTKAHSSHQRPIHSIVLDSLSTFYWQNRAEAESLQLEANTSEQPQILSRPAVPNPYSTLVQLLRALQQTFSCAIIATTHAFSFNARELGSPALRTLPAPWSTFPSVRLVMTREPVRKFALGMSVEEALKEQAGRQAVVERARFLASAVDGHEVFMFSIHSDGVTMEEED